MSDYGIKVSQKGQDADTAAFEDLIASSKYPTPKIKIGEATPHFGYGEYVVPAGTAKKTVLSIEHDYGYTAAPIVLVSTGGGLWRPAPTLWFFSGPEIDAYCTATHFKIEITAGSSSASGLTLKYRYYILDREGT